MKSGDIILFKAGKSVFSKLIAWGTKSEYSHVGVCVSPKMALMIEAEGTVRARDIRKIPVDYDVYRVKTVYKYSLDNVISFLVSKLNEKYDYAGVIYLGFLKALSMVKIPTKKMANKFQKDKDYFCSELVYEAFISGGIDIVPDLPSSDVTSPADISTSRVLKLVSTHNI